MAELIYLPGVVTLALDPEKCVGCGACTEVCPHQILSLRDGKVALGERDACMECGACANNCPTGAVTVDSGVGCAAAVIRSFFRRKKGSAACCC